MSQNGSVVLTNLKSDKYGVVMIDLYKYNILQNYQFFVRIKAYGQNQRVQRDYHLQHIINTNNDQNVKFDRY